MGPQLALQFCTNVLHDGCVNSPLGNSVLAGELFSGQRIWFAVHMNFLYEPFSDD
jgi:hypothetical protein